MKDVSKALRNHRPGQTYVDCEIRSLPKISMESDVNLRGKTIVVKRYQYGIL